MKRNNKQKACKYFSSIKETQIENFLLKTNETKIAIIFNEFVNLVQKANSGFYISSKDFENIYNLFENKKNAIKFCFLFCTGLNYCRNSFIRKQYRSIMTSRKKCYDQLERCYKYLPLFCICENNAHSYCYNNIE